MSYNFMPKNWTMWCKFKYIRMHQFDVKKKKNAFLNWYLEVVYMEIRVHMTHKWREWGVQIKGVNNSSLLLAFFFFLSLSPLMLSSF